MPQVVVAPQNNPKRPLLLVLHGGPGATFVPLMDEFKILEPHFLVCQWEQRGAGKLYGGKKAPQPTVEQLVEDTLAVARWLLHRYKRQKLCLMGFSWGSLLGVLAVHRAPQLFSAYVGVGQIANQLASEQGIYQFALQKARAARDQKTLQKLRQVGPPPYPAGEWTQKMMQYRRAAFRYSGCPCKPKLTMGYFLRALLACPFYSLGDAMRALEGMKNGGALFLKALEIDLNQVAPVLEIPVAVVQGEYDLQTLPRVAADYVQRLQAPEKHFFLMDNTGHSPLQDAPTEVWKKLDGIGALKAPWLAES